MQGVYYVNIPLGKYSRVNSCRAIVHMFYAQRLLSHSFNLTVQLNKGGNSAAEVELPSQLLEASVSALSQQNRLSPLNHAQHDCVHVLHRNLIPSLLYCIPECIDGGRARPNLTYSTLRHRPHVLKRAEIGWTRRMLEPKNRQFSSQFVCRTCSVKGPLFSTNRGSLPHEVATSTPRCGQRTSSI